MSGLILVAALALPSADGSTEIPILLLIGCSMSLAAITSIHFSVGRRSWVRLLFSIVALLTNGAVLASTTTSDEALLVALLPIGVATPISIVLESIKLRLGNFSKLPSMENFFREGLQFRIWHLLVATTVIAAICAVVRAISPWIREQDDELTYLLFVISACLSANTLLAIWALMGRQISARTPVSIAAAIGLFFVGQSLVPNFQDDPVWAGILFMPWFASGTYLLLLRREGWRFVRSPERIAE